DSVIMCHTLSKQLASWGIKVDAVEDAETTLRLLTGPGNDYDAAFIDWIMPGINGIEIARQARKEGMNPKTALHLITGAVSDDSTLREAALAAGYEQVMVKPITQKQLLQAIVQGMEKLPDRQEVVAMMRQWIVGYKKDSGQLADWSRIDFERRLSVLVAEDNAANQKLMTMFLEKMGHSVTLANNGHEAVECVRKAEFDLILMDCQMPVIDGYAATMMIRTLEKTQRRPHVPIVALTANADEQSRQRCLAAGMDEFVTKPVNLRKIGEVIKKFGDSVLTGRN
ncbi:MAG: response regulator, partial [Negativicutes bacterium]|nr:response regulator [Negativicutes bacterium]